MKVESEPHPVECCGKVVCEGAPSTSSAKCVGICHCGHAPLGLLSAQALPLLRREVHREITHLRHSAGWGVPINAPHLAHYMCQRKGMTTTVPRTHREESHTW